MGLEEFPGREPVPVQVLSHFTISVTEMQLLHEVMIIKNKNYTQDVNCQMDTRRPEKNQTFDWEAITNKVLE